jgi:hypothetical protein
VLLLVANGVVFVLVAPFLVLLAVPAVFFVLRNAKRGASPPRWAAAVTLSAAIWLLAAWAGANLTLFGNYALMPLLVGMPLTFAVARYGEYAFGWRELAWLLLLGPLGSVVMFWHPTGEMPGWDALRNLRPFWAPAPPPRRRKPNDR